MSILKVTSIQHSSASTPGITLGADGSVGVQTHMGMKNKIINGNFDIWQRGTSSSTAGYLADRWRTVNSGSTFTSSRQSFTLGQTDVPNEPSYFHRTSVTSSAGSGNYCLLWQPIESVRTLAGQTATLSFWAKADASKNMAVEFAQYFGTGGSPSSAITAIDVTTCALTTSWQKFTINVSMPSISGKTLGTDHDGYVLLVFWFDAGSVNNSRTNSLGQQSGTFDIAQVQLEAGSVATPFEVRPLGVELQLCQRYYEKSVNLASSPTLASGAGSCSYVSSWATSTGSVQAHVPYRIRKRSLPTFNTSDGAGTLGKITALNVAGSSWVDGDSYIVASQFEYGINVYNTTARGAINFNWTADAEL